MRLLLNGAVPTTTTAIFMTLLLLFALVPAGGVAQGCQFQPDNSVRCETIHHHECHGLHSIPEGTLFPNSTSFPNVFGHRDQSEATRFLDNLQLQRLVTLNCSVYARIFICSAVFPLCYYKQFQRVEPCREMCLAVKESCAMELETSIGQTWPRSLDCDQFARYGTQLCVWNQISSDCSTVLPTAVPTVTRVAAATTPTTATTSTTTLETFTVSVPSSSCTGYLLPVNDSRYASFGGGGGGDYYCAQPCRGVYFEDDNNTLITLWTVAISAFSLMVAMLVLVTFLLNIRSIRSLESPIYYITLCYGLLSLTNLLSAAVGRDAVVCDNSGNNNNNNDGNDNNHLRNSYNESVLVADGLSSPACSTLFGLLYYFTLCTWSWWAVLAAEWAVCALRRRASVGVGLRMAFHFAAWGVPSAFLIFALLARSVSGDPVRQTCWVSRDREVAFVLVPLGLAVCFCSVLTVLAFAGVVKLRRLHFQRDRRRREEEGGGVASSSSATAAEGGDDGVDPSLLDRVGTYVTFYLLPMGLLFCTHFYDYWYREAWEESYRACSEAGYSSLQSCGDAVAGNIVSGNFGYDSGGFKPSVQVYMARVFASLCMGFVSVFWLMRQKLLLSWRDLCCFICVRVASRQYGKPPRPPRARPPPPPPLPLQPAIRIQTQQPSSSEV